MAITLQIVEDPRQLAYLARIAAACEKGVVAVEKIAVAAEAAVPFLKTAAEAAERAAVALEGLTQPPPAEGGLIRVVEYRFNGQIIQSTGGSVMFTRKVTDPGIPGTIGVRVKSITDSEGNPADFDGPPTWESDNLNVVDSIEVAADGLSAKLHLTNNVGAANVTMKAIENGVEKPFVDVVSLTAGDAEKVEFEYDADPVPDEAPSPSARRR